MFSSEREQIAELSLLELNLNSRYCRCLNKALEADLSMEKRDIRRRMLRLKENVWKIDVKCLSTHIYFVCTSCLCTDQESRH